MDRQARDYRAIPGKVSVEIQHFTKGDPRFQDRLDDGTVVYRGISIRELKEKFGSGDGTSIIMEDPFIHEKHTISLADWSNDDQDNTFLFILFRFTPDKEFVKANRDMFPKRGEVGGTQSDITSDKLSQ